MSTPVDGFRKNLTTQLPELHAECAAKVAKLDGELAEQREAQAFIERLAAAAQIDLNAKGRKNGESAEAPQALKG